MGWKYGDKLPSYKLYQPQLYPANECFRDPEDSDVLNVRCYYSGCEKVFRPTMNQVLHRSGVLKGRLPGSNNFYCSDGCKHSCPVFGKGLDYLEKAGERSRLGVETEEWIGVVTISSERAAWRKEVGRRNMAKYKKNYPTCEECGRQAEEVHHIEPVKRKKYLALDPPNGQCLCVPCHKRKHAAGKDISYGNLAKDVCGPIIRLVN